MNSAGVESSSSPLLSVYLNSNYNGGFLLGPSLILAEVKRAGFPVTHPFSFPGFPLWFFLKVGDNVWTGHAGIPITRPPRPERVRPACEA